MLVVAVAAGLALAPGTAVHANANAGWAELQQADIALGHRLIDQHRCEECHVRRVGGDGSAIYRLAGRINKPSALLAMVEMCNTQLNLQLFPEDVAAVAAALNQKHYRFKPAASP
jgi:hypothetical protein